MHNRDGWLAWRAVADGGTSPEEADIDLRFLLEEPTSYELRRLFRRFDGRDEALDRLEPLLTGSIAVDDEHVRSAAQAHSAELAVACAASGVEMPAAAHDNVDVVVLEDRPEATLQWQLLEPIAEGRSSAADGPTRVLRELLAGMFSDFVLVEHISSAVQGPTLSFPSYAALRATGLEALLTHQGTVALVPAAPTVRPGYTPSDLSWLTDDELAAHRADEDEAAGDGRADLARLLGSESWFAREMVAVHDGLDHAGVDALLADPDYKVRLALTTRMDLSADHAVALAGDANQRVVMGAVRLQVLPPETLTALASDPVAGVVAELALRNPATPLETVIDVARDGDSNVRAAIAKRADLPMGLALALGADEDRAVRLSAARNGDLPHGALEVLATDDDESVSRAAARTIRRAQSRT